MENAVKALLIAAAVIVAIVLITLGMNLLNTGSESIDNVDFSEYEIQQFNNKFKKFEGTNVSASEVNILIRTAYNHNNQQEDESTKIAVHFEHIGTIIMKDILEESPYKVPTGYRYTVKCIYSSTSKLITDIEICTIRDN